MKKNKKNFVIGISLVGVILVAIVICFFLFSKKEKVIEKVENLNYGRIDIDNYSSKENIEKYKNTIIKEYSEYQEVLKYYSKSVDLKKKDFEKNDYLVVIAEMHYCGGKINDIRKIDIQDKKVVVEIGINATCGPCGAEYYLFLIPVAKNKIDNNKEIEYKYITENNRECNPIVVEKPLIYFYPEKETEVTIQLGNKDKLTTTYPKYINKWKVSASPDGTLKDLETNKTYYGLYWEGMNTETVDIREEGFVVKGEDTISFLEEKLKILGLTEREANEFIVYWLPKMEHNEYNYIYFETMAEIEKNMPLIISPKPDSIIRINMEYKKLDSKIEVKEQKLVSPKRVGFTVVEWGGTVLK